MRILYIHQFFATRESSLGLIRSYEFARRWVEQGHEVTVITSASRLPAPYSERLFAEGEIDGIRVRSVRVAYDNRMGTWRRIGAFATFMTGATWLAVTAGRHDVVFATSTPLTVGIPGWLAAALRRTPFVFEVRDLWPEAAVQMGAIRRGGMLEKVAKGLERFLYRRAKRVVALSPGMAAGVIGEGIPPERVVMVPNSSDLDLFSPGPRDAELVARYGLGDRFVVGYAGAIGPSNAVEDNVPAAASRLLREGRTDIVFLIAGAGKSVDELQRRCDGLPNVVIAGSMPKAEVPRFTRTADVLLVLFADKPILATNSPNKFFDALASGRPVIVNSDGWTREIVESDGAGMYFPAGDGDALAEAVIRLADDEAARADMGTRGRGLAESRFARDILAEQVLTTLSSAAATDR
ncbi:MAG: glycosyltransferase family 4 protein [Coriobacteriia bacterium]|nr:glycosyltransferase family 4 protein [Coriobacteriia bacterium]